MSRLTRERKLLRVSSGVYVRSIESRFGIAAPPASKVAMGVAALKGHRVATHGAAAANALGLTTQVPMREIFITTGTSCELRLGKQVIELRHAPAWQLTLADHPGGEVIRALAWLGREEADAAIPTLRSKVTREEAQEIAMASSRLPSWLARLIESLAA